VYISYTLEHVLPFSTDVCAIISTYLPYPPVLLQFEACWEDIDDNALTQQVYVTHAPERTEYQKRVKSGEIALMNDSGGRIAYPVGQIASLPLKQSKYWYMHKIKTDGKVIDQRAAMAKIQKLEEYVNLMDYESKKKTMFFYQQKAYFQLLHYVRDHIIATSTVITIWDDEPYNMHSWCTYNVFHFAPADVLLIDYYEGARGNG